MIESKKFLESRSKIVRGMVGLFGEYRKIAEENKRLKIRIKRLVAENKGLKNGKK